MDSIGYVKEKNSTIFRATDTFSEEKQLICFNIRFRAQNFWRILNIEWTWLNHEGTISNRTEIQITTSRASGGMTKGFQSFRSFLTWFLVALNNKNSLGFRILERGGVRRLITNSRLVVYICLKSIHIYLWQHVFISCPC